MSTLKLKGINPFPNNTLVQGQQETSTVEPQPVEEQGEKVEN